MNESLCFSSRGDDSKETLIGFAESRQRNLMADTWVLSLYCLIFFFC